MKLRGEQIKKLQAALLSAFPNIPKLTMMVRMELDESLANIAGDTPLSEMAFQLIVWAESCGRLEELVEKAHHNNPGNVELSQFAEIVFEPIRKAREPWKEYA